jgi:hypothetical protein
MLVAAAALVLAAGCGGNKITVSGTVLNHRGVPLSGAVVTIGKYGEHWPAYTNGNGQFTMEEVEIPYDACVLAFYCYPLAEVAYEGLTRSDPVFTVAADVNQTGTVPPTNRSATIAGQLSPLPDSGDSTCVAFCCPDFYSFTTATNGNFSWSNTWIGQSTQTGSLYALQWQNDAGSGLPATYKGYGTRGPLDLSSGANLTGQDIALSAVGTSQVSGAATLPGGYSLLSRTMGLRVDGFGYLPIAAEYPPAAADFTYQVPQVAGGKIEVVLTAQNAAGDFSSATWLLSPGASGAAMALPTAVALVQPGNAAAGINPGAPFSWTAFAGGLHTLGLATWEGSVLHTYTAHTAGTDFSRDEWPYQNYDQYTWTVSGSTQFSSVDEATSGPLSSGSDAAFGTAVSAPWGFSTSP